MASRLYDPACEDLSRHFLGDKASALIVSELAFGIQEFIEGWLKDELAERITEVARK